MPETRPDDRIYLQRISFDGYGCCNLGTKAAPLDQKDSLAFKEAIRDIVNRQEILDKLVRKAIKLNQTHIWARALKEYFDIS
jgi:hypothetical protein